ncbi:hypothetical protein KJ708_09595 [bacterium]|nr:hypothetical protein [bacterium]
MKTKITPRTFAAVFVLLYLACVLISCSVAQTNLPDDPNDEGSGSSENSDPPADDDYDDDDDDDETGLTDDEVDNGENEWEETLSSATITGNLKGDTINLSEDIVYCVVILSEKASTANGVYDEGDDGLGVSAWRPLTQALIDSGHYQEIFSQGSIPGYQKVEPNVEYEFTDDDAWANLSYETENTHFDEEVIEVQTVKIKFTTVPTTEGSAAAGTLQLITVEGDSVTIQFEGVLEVQINK